MPAKKTQLKRLRLCYSSTPTLWPGDSLAQRPIAILALDEALSRFAQVAPRQAKVVELRYFGGLSEEEIAAALNTSPRTVRRDWELARAWLLRELDHSNQRKILGRDR